jgi:hypothetical protein
MKSPCTVPPASVSGTAFPGNTSWANREPASKHTAAMMKIRAIDLIVDSFGFIFKTSVQESAGFRSFRHSLEANSTFAERRKAFFQMASILTIFCYIILYDLFGSSPLEKNVFNHITSN